VNPGLLRRARQRFIVRAPDLVARR